MQQFRFSFSPPQGHGFSPDSYEAFCRSVEGDPSNYWNERAKELLHWYSPWSDVVTSDFRTAHTEWFVGAEINVSVNCVDRHAERYPHKPALLWEGNSPGSGAVVTYGELLDRVERAAALLRSLNVGRGDRVAIYLPMVPEAVYAMLACTRIGAIHTVVFAGFSSESLRDRINDCSCKVLITADEAVRGEKGIRLKEIADKAIAECPTIERVLIVRRTGAPCAVTAGRDLWWHEEMSRAEKTNGWPERMSSGDPLFILYTSGSTGKPKGVLHTQGGYLLYAAHTHRIVFDLRHDDVHFCTADIGWITGHSYVVYGPLANGVTTVLFEPTPVFPDPGRYWSVVERTRTTVFYTAPTAIRTLAREPETYVTRYDRSSLRVLGTVGEPINPDAWNWYAEVVGEGRCPVVDTWWQTETGGVLISPVPNVVGTKPGSASRPLPGISPILLDDSGKPQLSEGRLCMRKPWPGIMRTVYGDHERFRQTYFSQFPGNYFTGDGCRVDSDGFYWITGRVDDVLNVAGHRLGTAELEAAIVRSGIVAEAAVVGIPHEIKGQGICAFCVAQAGVQPNTEHVEAVKRTVREVLSPIATPDRIHFVPGLPKTRSGKIMRRILRGIAAGSFDGLGDTSTLADPGIVREVVRVVKGG